MKQSVSEFRKIVLNYYQSHGRHDLPWRQPGPDGSFDPYKILVSEIMLQQTQVPRVMPKFNDFIRRFPSFQALADAPLSEVLVAWNGLGYNRRAKFLWQAAQRVVDQHSGALPDRIPGLVALPGIGPNTAGALLAYAYNRPAVFVETNIRTVFIYHFFAGQEQISDKAIADQVAAAVPDEPRTWYWALMDYGTYLKQTVGNLNTLSRHYTKQSVFQGSRRQVRGQVLRALGHRQHSLADLQAEISDERLPAVLSDLEQEGLVHRDKTHYKLAGA